jgi:hypothetical protein
MVQPSRMVLPSSRMLRVPSGSNNGNFITPDYRGKKGFHLFCIKIFLLPASQLLGRDEEEEKNPKRKTFQ